jgi:hypothetical protein
MNFSAKYCLGFLAVPALLNAAMNRRIAGSRPALASAPVNTVTLFMA